MSQNVSTGMMTFDQSLIELYKQGKISEEVALANSDIPGDMKIKMQKVKLGGDGGAGLEAFDTSSFSISE